MIQGNQFRIYPTKQQAKSLLSWIGCQRNIYNAKVEEDRYFRSFAKKSMQHVGEYAPIDQQYSHFKTELTPYLNEVPSVILRNGASLWKEAYSRFFRKLGGRPKLHKKHGAQSVWITSELFEFIPVVDTLTGEIKTYRLMLGTKKFPIGEIKLNAHRAFRPPASIHITIHAGRWTVGFTNQESIPEPKEAETLEWLRSFSQEDLLSATIGIDRGVNIKIATSQSQGFDLSDTQKKRIRQLELRKKYYQRKMARQIKGSARREKSKHHVARISLKMADMRHNLAHQASHAIVSDQKTLLVVFESLKVKNMTASAKGSIEAPGRNIKQKAGLNRSILGAAWGKTYTFAKYKAKRAGKLCIEVSPHFSSQECAHCGHIHPDNRKNQSDFVCLSCGNEGDADFNAAKVIAKRGVIEVLNNVPAGSRKQAVSKRPTLEETIVSLGGGNAISKQQSLKRETPTTTVKV